MSLLPKLPWLLLVISLSGKRATTRMRVWRALKGLGAAVLRDGVYLLPAGDTMRKALEEQLQEVIRSGGKAHVFNLAEGDPEQTKYFQSQFDRSHDYARVIEVAHKLMSGLSRRKLVAATRKAKQLRREFDAIRATDYFSGTAAEHAAQTLSEVEVVLSTLASPGEPRVQSGNILRLDRKEYRGRLWATRAKPWVDRLASAWLIRRFIDTKARVVWLKNVKDCPAKALGFDFDGAAFTHVGARVTFEVLLASFGLEKDPALSRLGAVVHYLDVGGLPVAEASGLKMILGGARQHYVDDDKLLSEASKTLDYLYASYSKE